MMAKPSFSSQLGDGNSSEFHIFPGEGTCLAQNVRAAVHSDHLKVVLLRSNLLRRQFSEFRGECDEATIAGVVGEDAGLEGLAGFFINECTDLHTPACCECQQRGRVYDFTHTIV